MFFWRDGQFVCDNPRTHRQLALTSAGQRVVASCAEWTDVDDCDTGVVAALRRADILVEQGSAQDAAESELGPWAQWGTAATYYHLSTRTAADQGFLSPAEDAEWLRAHLPERPPPTPFVEAGDAPLLPLPNDDELLVDVGFDATIRARRTTRCFDPAPIAAAVFGTFLHRLAGVQRMAQVPGLPPAPMTVSPSGGARHAVESYVVVRAVESLAPGVYRYLGREHALVPVPGAGPHGAADVRAWCGDQRWAGEAAALLVHTAVLERTAWKYRTGRVYRSLYAEVGHLSQTAYLLATALGLGVFYTAALRDAAVEDALGLDWRHEIPLGVNGIGVPTATERRRQAAMLAGGPAAFSMPRPSSPDAPA